MAFMKVVKIWKVNVRSMMSNTIELIFYSGDKSVIDPYEYLTEITFDYPVEKLYEGVINYKYQLSNALKNSGDVKG